MKVGLLGFGVVGSGVGKIVDSPITKSTEGLEIARILVKNESDLVDSRMTLHIEDIVNDPSIDVVCECIGGLEPAATYVKQAIEHGKHVVTSNKKMLATYASELFALAKEHHVQIKYEASCGGGIPWIHEIEHVKRIDEIQSYKGIFNGTSNYILSRMNAEGKTFDAMLEEAQALGYAERNPSDDIDGFDVRYKVALSCMSCFDLFVDPSQIPTYGIRYISQEDMDFCKENGYVCKLIGQGIKEENNVFLAVYPTFLKKESILACIPLNFNGIEYETTTLGKAMFIGQGAGSLPTAHAVVQDLIDLNESVSKEEKESTSGSLSASSKEGIYYIRTKKLALLNPELIERRVGNDSVLTKEVSFMELNMAIQSIDDESVFVAEVEQ